MNAKVFTPENLVDFVCQLARARLVLSVDTATAHIATAMDKKTVIIFGAASELQCIPWSLSKRQKWLCRFDAINNDIIKRDVSRLSPQEIIEALNEVLNQNSV
jgi:ADP-heptose:LPS heptosyltransferase